MADRSSVTGIRLCPRCRTTLKRTDTQALCRECGLILEHRDGIWTRGAGFTPEGFSERSRRHLESLEHGHFWFRGRQKLLERILQKLQPDGKPVRILELGCGSGSMLRLLERHAAHLTGADGHFASLQTARRRSRRTTTLYHGDILQMPCRDASYDLVCAFDVLEHVEAEPFFREVRRLLAPGGTLLLSVPAFMALWSPVDERAGHRCRYTLARMRRELEAGGLELGGWTHYQFFLFPLIWFMRRFRSANGRSDTEAAPPALINKLLDAVNRTEVALFAGRSLPFGSSLIVWATVQSSRPGDEDV